MQTPPQPQQRRSPSVPGSPPGERLIGYALIRSPAGCGVSTRCRHKSVGQMHQLQLCLRMLTPHQLLPSVAKPAED